MARLLRAFNKYARFYALTLVILTMVATLHIGACLICSTLEICEQYFLLETEPNSGEFSWESNDNQSICSSQSGVYHLYAEALYVTFTLLIGMGTSGDALKQTDYLKMKGGVSISQAMKTTSWVGADVYFVGERAKRASFEEDEKYIRATTKLN